MHRSAMPIKTALLLTLASPIFGQTSNSAMPVTDTLDTFGAPVIVLGNMQMTSSRFVDGLFIDIMSPTNRTMTIQKNASPLSGKFVTGASGSGWRAAARESYVVQMSSPSKDMVGSFSIPFNEADLKAINIDPANTAVGKLDEDGTSWEVEYSKQTIDMANSRTGMAKIAAMDGEYILLGRTKNNTVGNVFMPYGSGAASMMNFTGGSGMQSCEYMDGFRISASAERAMGLTVDMVTPLDQSMFPAGYMPIYTFAYRVSAIAPGMVPSPPLPGQPGFLIVSNNNNNQQSVNGVPAAAQLGGAQSGGTQSGGTQSGGTQSDGTQSGGTQSGGTQSGGTQSGGTQSGGVQSDGAQSGGAQSGGTQSGGAQSGGAQSGGAQSGGTQSGGAQSGGVQSSGAQSSGAQSGGAQSGGAQSGGAQSGGAQSGDAQSDGTQSGGTQSGGTQSGGTQSGGTQSGDAQSGGIQSGGSQSGGAQSVGSQSSGTQSGGTRSGGAQSGGIPGSNGIGPGGMFGFPGAPPIGASPPAGIPIPFAGLGLGGHHRRQANVSIVPAVGAAPAPGNTPTPGAGGAAPPPPAPPAPRPAVGGQGMIGGLTAELSFPISKALIVAMLAADQNATTAGITPSNMQMVIAKRDVNARSSQPFIPITDKLTLGDLEDGRLPTAMLKEAPGQYVVLMVMETSDQMGPNGQKAKTSNGFGYGHMTDCSNCAWYAVALAVLAFSMAMM